MPPLAQPRADLEPPVDHLAERRVLAGIDRDEGRPHEGHVLPWAAASSLGSASQLGHNR